MARQMLERFYSKAFVDRLANGEYVFVATNPEDGDKTYARDEVDAALIGGIKVAVGDQMLDASVRGKLDAMATALKN